MKKLVLFCPLGLLFFTGFMANGNSRKIAGATSAHHAYTANTTYPLLRLKLVVDVFNYDDIAIAFNDAATTVYNPNLDSRYFPGINAAEGLASLSSDGVKLSVNIVPLPKQAPLNIKLDVEVQNSGQLTLEQTELDTIPAIYDIWLFDKYKKDSLNLRTTTSYRFSVDKTDSASFGSNRFVVTISQNPRLWLRLLAFDAYKETNTAKITWTTEYEQNNTHFTVERSIDGGKTFFAADTLKSSGLGYYTFVDANPVYGSDVYRLKLEDVNGSITYSGTVSLSFGSPGPSANTTAANSVSIYPNPSSGMINLAISANSSSIPADLAQNLAAAPAKSSIIYGITIININGKVIKTATTSSASWQNNVGSLAPGPYIIQVINTSNNNLVGKSVFVKL